MRIGVALAFFSAGLEKYRSFDYATQLFQQLPKTRGLSFDFCARFIVYR